MRGVQFRSVAAQNLGLLQAAECESGRGGPFFGVLDSWDSNSHPGRQGCKSTDPLGVWRLWVVTSIVLRNSPWQVAFCCMSKTAFFNGLLALILVQQRE